MFNDICKSFEKLAERNKFFSSLNIVQMVFALYCLKADKTAFTIFDIQIAFFYTNFRAESDLTKWKFRLDNILSIPLKICS